MVRIDDLATSVKSLLQSIDAQPPLGRFERAGEEEADPQHLARLLRACRERPRNCCAAEQRDELAPFELSTHSITSSASNCSELGTSMPSALAVCKLMTNSNLVDCVTGRSAGLAPLRI